ALGKYAGDDADALSAWWRMRGERDLSLPRAVLRRRDASDQARSGAIYLLARNGDPEAIAIRDESRRLKCAEALGRGRIGLMFIDKPFEKTGFERFMFADHVVDHVCPGGRGAQAGFLPGDNVQSIGGESCWDWGHCHNLLYSLWERT